MRTVRNHSRRSAKGGDGRSVTERMAIASNGRKAALREPPRERPQSAPELSFQCECGLPLTALKRRSEGRRRTAQKGGKRAYEDHLRKDRSARESRHSVASVKEPSPLTIDKEFIPQLRTSSRGAGFSEPPLIKETIRLFLADRSRLGQAADFDKGSCRVRR